MRRCNECKDGILCEECINQVNENKDFQANLNSLERQAPNEFGHMLLYCKVFIYPIFFTRSSVLFSLFLLFISYTLASFFNSSSVY